MEEFSGTDFNDCNDEIVALVTAVCHTKKPMFTVLNGVKLVADPKQYAVRPDYTDELQWTFWHVFNHRAIVTASLGARDAWYNLVPELETLCPQLVQEIKGLDQDDPRALLNWFIRLGSITWCRGVLSDEQADFIRATIGGHEECRHWRYAYRSGMPTDHKLQGYHLVKDALNTVKSFALPEKWLEDTQRWLTTKA